MKIKDKHKGYYTGRSMEIKKDKETQKDKELRSPHPKGKQKDMET